MSDHLSQPQRAANMAAVRGKNTVPERIVRSMVHAMGYRFRLHRKDLPGKPDLAFPTKKKAIFVHGCFWHRHEGCPRASSPKTRMQFWESKFDRNIERDRRVLLRLSKIGWESLIIWECEIKSSKDLAIRLAEFLRD
jgi:DNA mismatch endonuclease, patch repair protein